VSFFSVITINYNNLNGIKRTVESVINQTFESVDFIIIDGGSTDGSKEYIEKYSEYFDYWLSESDSGVYHAMNKGWKQAKGKYCIFMNSGDIFANPEVLYKAYLEIDIACGVIYGCHLWGSINGERWNPKKDFKFREIMTVTPISHQATFIKRSQLEKVGGFKEQYKIIADWGVLIDSMLSMTKLQKIQLDICIAEEPGESNVINEIIEKERIKYLKSHHLSAFLWNKYVVLPLISIKRIIIK
jgi:glycosyltransferase involved in cell wall biosynthesis